MSYLIFSCDFGVKYDPDVFSTAFMRFPLKGHQLTRIHRKTFILKYSECSTLFTTSVKHFLLKPGAEPDRGKKRVEKGTRHEMTWHELYTERRRTCVCVCVCARVCVYKHPWVVQVCHMVLFQVVCVELNGTCLVYLVYTSVPTLVCVIKGATSTTVRWKHEESEWPTEPWVSPSERPAVQTAGTRPARWWCRPWSAGEEWRQTPGSTHRCLQHNIFCHFY